MLYAIAILLLLAIAGLVAGWIRAPAAPRWIWVVLFVCCISAAGFLTYLQVSQGALPNSSSASPGKMLSPDSPVKVRWFGQGDTIEVSWDVMDYPDLEHYSVDVYGLTPVQIDYNVGYRRGDELRTSDTANPIAEANEWLKQDGRSEQVTNDETWRVCVIGMKDTPGGVDISPYIIKGSKRCSDPFTIPKG